MTREKPNFAATDDHAWQRDTLPENDSETRNRRKARRFLSPELAALRGVQAVEGERLNTIVDLPSLLATLKDQTRALQAGSSDHLEAMLLAQATTLQTVFTCLLEKAMKQEHVPKIEALMRLALKAQSQGRSTIETLTAIRSPPAVYSRQTNIAHGPQQINNGVDPEKAQRREKTTNTQNEQLEHRHGERLDTGAQGAAGEADSDLETVGVGEGADDPAG